MTKKTAIQLKLDPNKPESEFRLLGGGKMDEWNKRLSDITVNALPIAHSKNKDAITEACLAVSYGVMDMAPADPVEGILIAQLMAANEAALAMYQKGWAQPVASLVEVCDRRPQPAAHTLDGYCDRRDLTSGRPG